jgi:ubiquinone/menaquinone biosynthesis C-methylase UbiE
MMYGSEKWICESSRLKRFAYGLLGELHVPGRLRAYHVLRQIRRLGLFGRPVKMLDAGCGRGDLAIHLARRFPHWSIVGLDLNPERLSIARQVAQRLGLTNVEFCMGRLEDDCFDSEFDLIVNADVLEHIPNDREVIEKLCRALRPQGYLIVTSPSVPQRKHLGLVHWRERQSGFEPSQHGHVRAGYSHEDLSEKVRSAGGQVVNSYFTFGFFGTLAFDLFFVIGDNRPNPVIFALAFPWLMALAGLDLVFPSQTGSAVLAVARRS